MNQNSLSIAYVDDETDMHIIFKARLAHEISDGLLTLVCFESGQDLLTDLQQRGPPAPYSVVLLDINMPGMDGFEVLKQMKTSFPEIDVVMVTGYDRLDYKTKALSMGAKDYFVKPLDIKKLKHYLFVCNLSSKPI